MVWGKAFEALPQKLAGYGTRPVDASWTNNGPALPTTGTVVLLEQHHLPPSRPQALVHRHMLASGPDLHLRLGWPSLAAATPPLASWRRACACACSLLRPGGRNVRLHHALGIRLDGGGRGGPPGSLQVRAGGG